MKNLRLSIKIGLGFGAMIMLSVGLGLVAVEKMGAIHAKADVLAHGLAPLVDISNNLERQVLKTMFSLRGYVGTGDKSYLRDSEQELTRAEQYLQNALALGERNPDLVQLRASSTRLAAKLKEFMDLVDKTVSVNDSITSNQALVDKAAKNFMDSCQSFLSGSDAREERGAARPANGQRETGHKTMLIGRAVDLGNSVQVDSYKARVLRNPDFLQNALTRFEEISRTIDDLRASTPRESSLGDTGPLREATRQYKVVVEDLLGDLTALQDVSSARRNVTDIILEIAQATAKDGVANTLEIVREAERSLSDASMVLLAGLAVASILGLSVAIFTSRGITRPMVAIVGALGELARGDCSRVVEYRSRDEVGQLADAFRKIQTSLKEKTAQAEAIAAGDYSREVAVESERDVLGTAINRMTAALRQSRLNSEIRDWIKTGLNGLADRISGAADPWQLADRVLCFLSPYLGVQGAVLYLLTEESMLSIQGIYASQKSDHLERTIPLGDGIAGQAAICREIVSVKGIPGDCLRVNSFFCDVAPGNLLALPFIYQENLIGVLELAALEELPDHALEFLRLAAEPLAVAFDSIRRQAKVRELLERTQDQARQLLEQQEELKAANEELEEHTDALRRSEEELRQQQEELQTLNEELEEKNSYLEQQKSLILENNASLELARQELERKAAELEVTSRYKSEFLANMSHELRTPLNSLLLLSRSLRDNASGRLSLKDVEAAGIIHKNGNDLLELINDILDLSKIEAGKMTLNLETVRLEDMAASVDMDFRLTAEQKGLSFKIEVEDRLPAILTDSQRLGQILRNLVSNAVKFTEQGEVTVRIHRPAPADSLELGGLDSARAVAFSVSDTGIGIPPEKHAEIFEAFQQVDGSTSRRYGGTGLGLAITRELSRLLGGKIRLKSEPGRGSTFTLYLPESGPVSKPDAIIPAAAVQPPTALVPPPQPIPSIPDDRHDIGEKDKVILIIEDDPAFASILAGLCRDKGFKILAAATGEDGLTLAEERLPTAIILDIRLPGISGFTVLNSLKKNHKTRHMPVHVISAIDTPHDALILGAMGFLTKPVEREDLDAAIERIEAIVDRKVKELLLVEDNADLRQGIHELIRDLGVNMTEVETGQQAMEALRSRRFDCVILDLGLSDMSGFELLKRLEEELRGGIPPIIVYTGKDLTKDEERELRRHAQSIIVKGARSAERLLDEVTLFLHHMVSALPTPKQRMIIDLHNRDAMLEGKKVLVVDDDMRNLFAVSKVLEEKGLDILNAENGAKALETLEANPDVDLVLLDIMMPVMDGYTTTRNIRAQSRFTKLPVIALTAKAMKEDREKCIAAGANDYLAKPVDVDKLLSMMRVWLYGK